MPAHEPSQIMAPFTKPRKAPGKLLIFFMAMLPLASAQTPAKAPLQTPAQAPEKTPPPARKPSAHQPVRHPDNSLLKGGKFEIGEIVTLLRSVRSGRVKQARLIEAIQSRGVAFAPSELNLARLMNSGAAEPVLEAIEKLSAAQPPPAPIPEPVKPSYTLVVTCEPAECETRVGDQEFRQTAAGKATFINLPPGRIILDARKPGFETKTEIVALDPASLSPSGSFQHAVALTPTVATQKIWGSSLLASVSARAKVPADQATVSGTLTITESGSTEWKLTAHLLPNGANSLDLENSHGKVIYLSSAGFWQSKSSRKSPFRGTREEKAKAESALLRNMDMWIAFEYFSMVRRMAKAETVAKSLSNPALAGGPKELQIPTAQGVQIITLNSDLQPATVSISNPTGANTPAKIEFSGYRQMGGGIYPGRTLIKFSDSETHTLLLTADKFEDEKTPVRAR